MKTSWLEALRIIVPAVLGLLALALYGSMNVLLVFHEIPKENKDIVSGAMNLIGGSLVGCAFGFYFGSSATLAHRAPAEPSPATPAQAKAPFT